MNEMKIVMAKIYQNFEFELSYPDSEVVPLANITLRALGGINVNILRRHRI